MEAPCLGPGLGPARPTLPSSCGHGSASPSPPTSPARPIEEEVQGLPTRRRQEQRRHGKARAAENEDAGLCEAPELCDRAQHAGAALRPRPAFAARADLCWHHLGRPDEARPLGARAPLQLRRVAEDQPADGSPPRPTPCEARVLW